jgi:hypothetical protein
MQITPQHVWDRMSRKADNNISKINLSVATRSENCRIHKAKQYLLILSAWCKRLKSYVIGLWTYLNRS